MAKHDWKDLKTEFINGPFLSLTSFFESKKIAPTTWFRRTNGWKEKREEVQGKIAEKAQEKIIQLRAKRLAKRAEDAQEMMDESVGIFRKKKGKLSARQAADCFKIASEVQDKATQPDKSEEPLAVPIAIGVGMEFNQDELKSLRIVAKSVARTKAGI